MLTARHAYYDQMCEKMCCQKWKRQDFNSISILIFILTKKTDSKPPLAGYKCGFIFTVSLVRAYRMHVILHAIHGGSYFWKDAKVLAVIECMACWHALGQRMSPQNESAWDCGKISRAVGRIRQTEQSGVEELFVTLFTPVSFSQGSFIFWKPLCI